MKKVGKALKMAMAKAEMMKGEEKMEKCLKESLLKLSRLKK